MKFAFALFTAITAAFASPLATRQEEAPFGIVSPAFNQTISTTAVSHHLRNKDSIY
jgi:hypothetical protein